MLVTKIKLIGRLRKTFNSIVNHLQIHTTVKSYMSAGALVIEGKGIHFKSEKNIATDVIRGKTESNYLADDPDTFGTLSGFKPPLTNEPLDEDEEREEKFLSNKPSRSQKLSTKQYADIIKDHLMHHRIKEALDVLEVRILTEDRFKPPNYIYNLLIGGCARVGYTKKAFMLFNDMKRRGLKATGGTYTSLFNACANSPWPATDGHKRACDLRNLMLDKLIEPNVSNYNSILKAFGRAGDLVMCFRIIDEMVEKKIKLRVHIFNFLMQSCISDKDSGFRHGLIVWKKMIERREKPNIYSFNLLLKCIKDCSLGDEKQIEEMLQHVYGNSVILVSDNLDSDSIKGKIFSDSISSPKPVVPSISKELQIFNRSPEMTNSRSISVKAFCQLCNPQDRLYLFGGSDGFLKEMEKYSVEPNIKTFTLLLEVIPSTLEAEEALLAKLKQYPKLYADIDFYNMLIKKRCYRYDYVAAKSVIQLLGEENKRRKKKIYWKNELKLMPDIVTYGVLALTCKTFIDSQEFFKQIDHKRTRCNIEIMGTLLKHAIVADDVDYAQHILNRVIAHDIPPNKIFLERIQKYFEYCKYKLKNKSFELDESQKTKRIDFMTCYTKWLNKIDMDEIPENIHPWKPFRNLQPVPFQAPETEPVKRRYYKKKRKVYTPYRP